jgi:hypothetical protein
MAFGLCARDVRQQRLSPVSCTALVLTLALGLIGLVSSIATKFNLASLPNIIVAIVAIVVLDVLSQAAPPTRVIATIQILLYGLLYLMVTCVCGVLAA